MFDQPFLDQVFDDAVAMAVRAPSVHNSQPWRWTLTGDVIQLHADPDRQLPVTDPSARALVMSCGASLHHMRVALTVMGRRPRVRYLPDPHDPNHLASITVTRGRPGRTDIELAAAIAHRRSDRRRYDARPVPSAQLRQVSSAAPYFGAAARLVPPTLRDPLIEASHIAARRHADDAAYQRELALWSGRHGTPDGVPAANSTALRSDDPILSRAFADPELTDREPGEDGSEWLVICTPADDTLARLRAGEAASAVLLTATASTLASCLQTEPLGLPDLAAGIRTELLQDCAYPQAMVRLGWMPFDAAPLPATPRRSVRSVSARTPVEVGL